MPQRRSQATRQLVIDAAVELFTAPGYSRTALGDLIDRAGVTEGAFAYHFGTKEIVAAAVIAQGWQKSLEVITSALDVADARIENVIETTFAWCRLIERDPSVRVAHHLDQAFGQLSDVGRERLRQRAQTVIDAIAAALSPADLRAGVTPAQVGALVWSSVTGCLMLQDPAEGGIARRLSDGWAVLLPAIAPADGARRLGEFVLRTAAEYGPGSPVSPLGVPGSLSAPAARKRRRGETPAAPGGPG
jgi:AcrR family transcriptional regulator